MSDIKMSNWFKLPVETTLEQILGDCDSISFDGVRSLSSHHAEKVEYAINNHDRLAEENAQLKNQLHDLFEHVTGVSVSEYKLEQMPYLADYLIGQAEADDSCINKLKADKAELIAFVESVANCHAIIGIGDEDVSDKGRARKLLNKHKEQSNGN